MKFIPYIIAGLIILWAAFCLIRHFRKTKKGSGCDGCCGNCTHSDCPSKKKEHGEVSGE